MTVLSPRSLTSVEKLRLTKENAKKLLESKSIICSLTASKKTPWTVFAMLLSRLDALQCGTVANGYAVKHAHGQVVLTGNVVIERAQLDGKLG